MEEKPSAPTCSKTETPHSEDEYCPTPRTRRYSARQSIAIEKELEVCHGGPLRVSDKHELRSACPSAVAVWKYQAQVHVLKWRRELLA